MTRHIKEFLYKILEVVLTYIGRLHYSWHPFFIYYRKTYPNTCYSDAYEEIKKVIQPGDILLQYKKNQIINWFIPGLFSHVGIYVGDIGEKKGRIVHSSSPKVQVTDLFYFLKCNELAIVRPNITEAERDLAVQNVIDSIECPYDYTFIFEEKKGRRRLSCTGLLYNAFLHVRTKLGWKAKVHRLWHMRKVFIPDDVLPENGSNVTMVLRKKYK